MGAINIFAIPRNNLVFSECRAIGFAGIAGCKPLILLVATITCKPFALILPVLKAKPGTVHYL
jgi:hypothetical protein